MIKKLFVLVCCFYAGTVFVKCPLGDAYLKSKQSERAFGEYKNCAENLNDSESQLYVGNVYLDGAPYAPQSLETAYNYFRKGAENGYAPTQRELAKLIDAIEDMGDFGKKKLSDFECRWQKKNNLQRQPLSSLAWMTLAAEKAENKWFYDVPAIADAEATKLLPVYRSKKDMKEAEKQAVAFKQEKLMLQAKKLLSDSAYRNFKNVIYPDGKTKSSMTKAQAIENLKQYKMSIQK